MKRRIVIAIILFTLVTLSIYYFQILQNISDHEEWKEVSIDNGENSIFTDSGPSEIAENLAFSFNITPLISKMQEDQGCYITKYKFKYQNNTSINFFVNTKTKSLWSIFDSPITIYSDIDLGINISADQESMLEEITFIWKRFLNGFNIELMNYEYNITVKSLNNNDWEIYLRQTCNKNNPLLNTGFIITISENSVISTMNIFEWSKKEVEREFVINIDEAKDIIYRVVSKLDINKTKLNFSGFIYLNDNVYFKFEYEYKIDNESKYVPVIRIMSYDENGTVIEKTIKKNTFHFYVNVENGEFKCNDYGILKLLDTSKYNNTYKRIQ
jgi:hypothetical protein